METSSESRLCSVVSREAGDDPAGSSGGFSTALCVEVATPWARDVGGSKHFPVDLRLALAAADANGLFQKMTAFMPERGRSVPGHTRVFRFSRPSDAPFAHYEKSEFLVPDGEIGPAIGGILTGSDEHATETHGAAREVFVCAHNNRDVCCGRFGTQAHRALDELQSDDLRLWRCSHLGGHRFAPTMMKFPTGMVWGHVAPELAAPLVSRELPAPEAGRLYRGWSGLGSRYEQLLDRELLVREGWGWLDTPRTGLLLAHDKNSDSAEAEISTPHSTFTATVEPAGSVMTLASSGTEPLMEATQYRVGEIHTTR